VNRIFLISEMDDQDRLEIVQAEVGKVRDKRNRHLDLQKAEEQKEFEYQEHLTSDNRSTTIQNNLRKELEQLQKECKNAKNQYNSTLQIAYTTIENYLADVELSAESKKTLKLLLNTLNNIAEVEAPFQKPKELNLLPTQKPIQKSRIPARTGLSSRIPSAQPGTKIPLPSKITQPVQALRKPGTSRLPQLSNIPAKLKNQPDKQIFQNAKQADGRQISIAEKRKVTQRFIKPPGFASTPKVDALKLKTSLRATSQGRQVATSKGNKKISGLSKTLNAAERVQEQLDAHRNRTLQGKHIKEMGSLQNIKRARELQSAKKQISTAELKERNEGLDKIIEGQKKIGLMKRQSARPLSTSSCKIFFF
jgi:hypothetical protein